MIQFAVGDEPLALARGKPVVAWLHARIDDTTALTKRRQADLVAWLGRLDLGGTDADECQPRLVVSRDGEGQFWVHLYRNADGVVVETRVLAGGFTDLPTWLQQHEHQEDEAPPEATRRPARGRRTDPA